MLDLSYSLSGALTGFIVGLTGVGGGALLMPILLLLGVNPLTAVATDLWFAAITKLVAVMIHGRAGQVDWVVVRRLWLGSLPLALLVVVLVSMDAKVQKVDWLGSAISIVVLLTACGLLLAPRLRAMARESRVSNPAKFLHWQPLLTVLAGALLGVCVALTSVGAGALGSVLLIYLYPLRMTPHRLVATDIMHAIPLAVAAGIGYLIAGEVNGQMLLSLLAGSIPAVTVGSLLSQRLNGRWLQVALAFMLVAAGIKGMF